jgi:FimV-like protein
VIQAKAVWRSGKVQARQVLPLVKEFVESDSGRVAIISLPLTLLLMALLWRARGKRKAAEREQAASREEGEITPEGSAFATDQVKPMASVSPLAAKGHATQPVDAIAEADVYIAYGRTEQAEEILLDALSSQPEAHAYRLKLLEIYSARGDNRAFEAMYQDLQAASRGQGSVWAQATALAQRRHRAQPIPTDPTAATPTSASPVVDFERKLQGMLGERQGFAAAGTASNLNPDSDVHLMPGQRIEPSLAVIDLAALQTKLELAVACQEIGDYEGARELLVQVARARHPELAQRAQSLLQQIA